jgi:hypothetical protein
VTPKGPPIHSKGDVCYFTHVARHHPFREYPGRQASPYGSPLDARHHPFGSTLDTRHHHTGVPWTPGITLPGVPWTQTRYQQVLTGHLRLREPSVPARIGRDLPRFPRRKHLLNYDLRLNHSYSQWRHPHSCFAFSQQTESPCVPVDANN